MKVAFLGPRGTFCEEAARRYFSKPGTVFVASPDIPEIFRKVERGEADQGVVPIENSTEGSVNLTLDLLHECPLKVSGEVELRVRHNLIVKPGMKMGDVTVVMSHPQALAQCRRFLIENLPNAKKMEVASTAKAVEMLRRARGAAAIGTALAAEVNKVDILVRGIEDNPNNFTRFFVIGRSPAPPSGEDKTSIAFTVPNVPGSLYHALGEFAVRGINLTKIESRPTKQRPWEYIFYIDFEGHASEPRCVEALEGLRKKAAFLEVLGSYPKARS